MPFSYFEIFRITLSWPRITVYDMIHKNLHLCWLSLFDSFGECVLIIQIFCVQHFVFSYANVGYITVCEQKCHSFRALIVNDRETLNTDVPFHIHVRIVTDRCGYHNNHSLAQHDKIYAANGMKFLIQFGPNEDAIRNRKHEAAKVALTIDKATSLITVDAASKSNVISASKRRTNALLVNVGIVGFS